MESFDKMTLPKEHIGLEKVYLTEREVYLLSKIISSRQGNDLFEVLFEAIGKDAFLFLLDLLADESLRMPNIEEARKAIVDAKVYSFYLDAKNNQSDDAPYLAVAKWLQKRTNETIDKLEMIEKDIGVFNQEKWDKARRIERKKRIARKNIIKINKQVMQDMYKKKDENDDCGSRLDDVYEEQMESISKDSHPVQLSLLGENFSNKKENA